MQRGLRFREAVIFLRQFVFFEGGREAFSILAHDSTNLPEGRLAQASPLTATLEGIEGS